MSGRYAVIIEQGETSYGAYAPELLESLRANRDPVPPPSTVTTLVVPAPAASTSTSARA